MDEVVKVRRSFLNRIRGFLNLFANNCRGCVRKIQRGCLNCDNLRARILVTEIDNVRNAAEERYWIENPFEELLRRIMKAVEQGGGKVRSQEIRLRDVGRQKKWRAIRTLIRRGKLVRIAEGGETFFVLAKSNKNNKHKIRKN